MVAPTVLDLGFAIPNALTRGETITMRKIARTIGGVFLAVAVALAFSLASPAETARIEAHTLESAQTQNWGGGCSDGCPSHDRSLCYCCDINDCDPPEME